VTDHLAGEHLGLGRTEKYLSISLRPFSQLAKLTSRSHGHHP
jgi:hypothetical protein